MKISETVNKALDFLKDCCKKKKEPIQKDVQYECNNCDDNNCECIPTDTSK